MATKTGIRSPAGRPLLPRAVGTLALLLIASAGGLARANEAAPPPSGTDATNATDAASPVPAPVPAPVPLSAAATAARAAARVAARALPDATSPCPASAATAVMAIDFTPAGHTAEVWSVPLSAASRPTRVATLPRRPNAPLTAVVLPGTDEVAVAVVRRPDRDPTWSATVFLVGPGQKSRVLLERAFAGGPLMATADGRVVAVRGAVGPERAPSAAGTGFRRDSLEVVTVDPTRDSVEVRPISRQTGDALFLVGLKGNELFAYRVGGRETERSTERQPPNGPSRAPSGELISIDLGTGAVRVVVPAMPPLARDFSFDALSGTIWFAAARPAVDADGGDAGSAAKERGPRYALYGLDTSTARLSVVVAGDSLAFLPRAWPGDRVAFRCQDGSNALCLANRPGGAVRGRADRQVAHLIGNASASAEVQLVMCTDAGAVAFGVRRDPGRSFPTPFLWMVGESAARDVALPAGQVGFVGVVDLATPASAATLPSLAPAAR